MEIKLIVVKQGEKSTTFQVVGAEDAVPQFTMPKRHFNTGDKVIAKFTLVKRDVEKAPEPAKQPATPKGPDKPKEPEKVAPETESAPGTLVIVDSLNGMTVEELEAATSPEVVVTVSDAGEGSDKAGDAVADSNVPASQ